jgi:hypothetical protein
MITITRASSCSPVCRGRWRLRTRRSHLGGHASGRAACGEIRRPTTRDDGRHRCRARGARGRAGGGDARSSSLQRRAAEPRVRADLAAVMIMPTETPTLPGFRWSSGDRRRPPRQRLSSTNDYRGPLSSWSRSRQVACDEPRRPRRTGLVATPGEPCTPRAATPSACPGSG